MSPGHRFSRLQTRGAHIAHLAIDFTETEALSRLDAQFGALFHTEGFLEGQKAEAEGRKPVYRGN